MTLQKDDPRYDHTEADLMEAFQILARKKDPDRITVAEITRLTGVARSTFYNHYADMPALIDAAEDRIICEIFEMMIHFHPKDQEQACLHFYRSLCLYIRSNGFLVRMLAGPLASDFVSKALAMFHRYVRSVTQESPPETDTREYASVLAYSIGGVVGLLHRWACDGCREEPDEVAGLLSRLFFCGIHPFLLPATEGGSPPPPTAPDSV